jgi:hypothetical protein
MRELRGLGLGWLTAVSTLFALLISGASAVPAYAQSPVWAISSSSSPTNFAPGDETGDDKYVLTVVDAGGGSDAENPIEVSDTLPTGITASAVSGEDLGNSHALACNLTPKPTCTYEGFEMAPGDVLRIEVTVKVNSGVAASVTNSVSVGGGGGAATGAQAEDPTTISSNQAAFGISDFPATWSDTQAGAAVNLAAGFTFNQIASGGKTYPAADDKQAVLSLPPGFIANPLAVPYCRIGEASAGSCPLDTAVGVAFTSRSSGGGASVQYSSLVYNTAPELGQLGALTVFLPGVPLRLGMTLQTDGRLQLTAEDVPAVGLISTTLTLWGVPAAYDGAGPDHVQASGEPDFGDPGAGPPAARFLTSALSCGAAPDTILSAESWEAPGIRLEASSDTPTLTGCNRLPFSPSLSVAADSGAANVPSGYTVDLTLPTHQGASGLESSSVKDAAIALPPGAAISLSSANGMQACSEAQAALGSPGPSTCPEAAKVGTAEIQTTLLSHPAQGALYLATPYANPLQVPLALYMFAEDPTSGLLIRLVGQIEANQLTGQPTLVFDNLPQLPIGKLSMHFFGGARALLSTPPTCGTATSTAQLAPWSATTGVTAFSSFEIEAGTDGMSCSASRPFSPAFLTEAKATGEVNTVGSLGLFVSRPEHDEEQELGTISIEVPPALAQMFVGVPPCGEPEAAQGTCPVDSEVGTVAASAGLNAFPVTLAGQIYLSAAYGGSPQGLSIVISVDPGPFILGSAVVRAAIGVNPSTGALTLRSGQLSPIVGGVPLHLDELLLRLDRGTFKVNPACESLGVTGTITSTEGSTVQTASNPVGASSPPCPHSEPAPLQGGPKLSLIASGASAVRVVGTDVATNGRGVAKVKLACKGTARCLGSVTLTGKLGSTGKGHSKQDILGTAHFSLKAGATATIDVKLSARARSVLSFEHGSLRAVLSIRTSSPKPAQTHSVTVQLSTHKIRRHVGAVG